MEQAWNSNGAIDFFDLVRALERQRWNATASQAEALATPANHGVGEWGDYSREPIRFQAVNSLANPAHSVAAIQAANNGSQGPTWLVEVAFMGLIGPTGVLPPNLTTWLLGRGEAARPALRDLLAIFEHRFISRFYRAWEQSRCLHGFERAVRQNRDDNTHNQTLTVRALAGFADRAISQKLIVSDRLPAFYSGLLSNLVRPAENLSRLVSEALQVPCTLVEFVAEWQSIPKRQQTRIRGAKNGVVLGRINPANNQLGVSACMGSRVWTVQDRFRVRLGPLDYRTFSRFSPAGDLFRQLCDLVKLYVGTELAFDVQPVLKPEHVPSSQLGSRFDDGTRLGWNSWLGIKPHTRPASEAIFSSSR